MLQALPLLLQNYSTELRGPLLISAFQVCFLLQGSKTAVVSRTAAASLQQFLAFTFDKVTSADGKTPIKDGTSVELSQDRFRLFRGALAIRANPRRLSISLRCSSRRVSRKSMSKIILSQCLLVANSSCWTTCVWWPVANNQTHTTARS